MKALIDKATGRQKAGRVDLFSCVRLNLFSQSLTLVSFLQVQ